MTDHYSGKVVPKTFYCKRRYGFVAFKDRLVMENMTVCAGVVMANVIAREVAI